MLKKSKIIQSNFNLRKQTLLSVSELLLKSSKLNLAMDIILFSDFDKWLRHGVNISKYGQRKNLSNNEKFIVVYQGDFTRFIVN